MTTTPPQMTDIAEKRHLRNQKPYPPWRRDWWAIIALGAFDLGLAVWKFWRFL